MTRLSMRHRLFTPGVARAMTSPTAILAIAVGVAVGLVTGLGVVRAVVLGAVGWSARVAIAMYRGDPQRRPWRHRAERIDPFAVQEPWRWHVQTALANRAKVRERVDTTQAGPLRDRLREIAARVDTVADEVWRIAKRGQALAEARRAIDTARIDRQIADLESRPPRGAERDPTRGPDPTPGHETPPTTSPDDADVDNRVGDPVDDRAMHALEAHRAQRATTDRMDRVIGDTHSQLKLLDARMGEVVVRAVELSTQASGSDAPLAGLSNDVDGLVMEMEALRQALEETHGIAGGYRATDPGPPGGRSAGGEGSAGELPASDEE